MVRKLLLADDSITIQKVVELVLAEEGFEIKSANSGEEAITAMRTFRPDIVLADTEMPRMNGYQLCEKIKTNPDTKDIPVILLSGAFEPMDEELAKHVKADTFLVKPFESQELISKINAILSMPPAEAGEVFVAEAADEGTTLFAEAVEEVHEAVPSGIPGADFEAQVDAEAFEISDAEEINIAEAAEEAEAAISKQKPDSTIIEKTIVKMPPPVQNIPLKPASETVMLNREETSSLIKKAVDEKVTAMLASMDIKDILLSSVSPLLKNSIEKILWDVAPDLTEKLLKEAVQKSLASVNKEVEKVIWETVPDVAETMIAQEIKKIRSET